MNVQYMFNKCYSLERLTDLSRWNTENIEFMNGVFSECSSLTSLPDISKWKLKTKIFYSQESSFYNEDPKDYYTNSLNIRYIFYIICFPF